MMKINRKHKGMLSVELVVAISVLATIIGVLVALGNSFGKLNNSLWARHICHNAAQAQMDALATTGEPINDSTFEKLWPGVTCTVETTDGSGQWQGLQRIDLILSKKVKQKDVQIHLSRYLPAAEGGGQ
ncbi:MAG: type II secretion system GspH family protein [Phycisphaerae bacterium]|nr:type II secretion system GspH family protein [Phycisphaerae bacterium]